MGRAPSVDSDYDMIAEVTGQSVQRLFGPGTWASTACPHTRHHAVKPASPLR